MSQLHIPAKIRKDPALAAQIYGEFWRRPKHLCDVRALETIYGPPRIIRSEYDFRTYQDWMSDVMVEKPAVFVAADMGLGKTAAALYAFKRLHAMGKVKKCLILAPLNVAENTWPDEIAGWTFARDIKYTVVTGDEDERIAALQWDGDVHIVNRENLVWLKAYWGPRDWPYDMLIYDEASRLKSGRKRSKPNKRKDGTVGNKNLTEFGVLAQFRFTFKHVILLSGTPAPNGLIDLWGPIFIIDKGFRLGDSRSAFEERWFSYDHYTRQHKAFHHAQGEITSLISDVFFSLRSEDYLKLPKLIINDRKVIMPPKAVEMYKRLERDSVIEELNIEAVNGGVLTNKLLQLASGSLYHPDGTATHIHDAKLDELESIMVEAAGNPVLVGYAFKFDLERIRKRFPYARVFGENRNDLRDWNNGDIRMLVTHPASAGHGMNFQHGGNIAVWYGMTWSLELYQQFMKRLHRSGQSADHVIVHRIMAANTADLTVGNVIELKGVRQDDITDAVRIRLIEEQQVSSLRMAA